MQEDVQLLTAHTVHDLGPSLDDIDVSMVTRKFTSPTTTVLNQLTDHLVMD